MFSVEADSARYVERYLQNVERAKANGLAVTASELDTESIDLVVAQMRGLIKRGIQEPVACFQNSRVNVLERALATEWGLQNLFTFAELVKEQKKRGAA